MRTKRDSQGKTGKETIGALNKDMLLECYTTEDVREDYTNLRKRLSDPKTDNKEFAALLRMVWEFAMVKPPRAADITSKGESIKAGIFIDWGDEDEEVPTS